MNGNMPSVVISVYPALAPQTPDGIANQRVSYSLIMCDHFPRIPSHLVWLLESGAPLLAYGRPLSVHPLVKEVNESHPDLVQVEVIVFLRPRVPTLSADLAFGRRVAVFMGRRSQLRTGLPNYLSVEEGHAFHPDSPPMPVVEFFLHQAVVAIPQGVFAMFCRSPRTAAHWALTAEFPLNVVVGCPTDQPCDEDWRAVVARAAGDAVPPGLERENLPRVRECLLRGIPAWAPLEDAQLQQRFDRKEAERAEKAARTARKAAGGKPRAKRPKVAAPPPEVGQLLGEACGPPLPPGATMHIPVEAAWLHEEDEEGAESPRAPPGAAEEGTSSSEAGEAAEGAHPPKPRAQPAQQYQHQMRPKGPAAPPAQGDEPRPRVPAVPDTPPREAPAAAAGSPGEGAPPRGSPGGAATITPLAQTVASRLAAAEEAADQTPSQRAKAQGPQTRGKSRQPK